MAPAKKQRSIARHLFCCALAGLALLAVESPAQTYPSKPLRVIVPWPPGGTDVPLRVMQPALQEEFGQQLVIENRAGANGIIGTDYMSKQPPDGYTLLWTSSNPIVTGPVTTPKEVAYDPVKDLTNVSKLLLGVSTIAAPASLPVNSLKELIEYAKRNPGKLSYSSAGVGSVTHADGEMLKLHAGIDLLHIPYKGFGQVLPDLIANRVQLAFIAYMSVVQQVDAGKLKILAVFIRPHPRLPGTAVVEEQVRGFERLPVWTASVHAPAGMLRPVLNRIYGALSKTLARAELRRRLENDDGYIIVANTPDEFATEVKESLAKTAATIKLLGVSVQ
jgi:tripartite-type tricarboxylate transporter receptor subunit TctC